jgi:glycosyltransferase involved in cell wall biosynthesis
MAQSAQSLYDGLRQGGLVVVRKTPQDYRFPWLFLPRLLRNIVWADVIHVQTANIITALTNAIVPVVLGERLGKSCIISYKGGYPEEFLARYDSILRRFLRKAMILVTTEWMANCFRRYGYECFVIPNVVEVGAFLKVKHERGSQRLIVCRHPDRRYNIPMALRAFKIIKRKFPRATLTVVGDGPMRNELGLLSNELSLADVRFQPSVPHLELPKIYAKADLFLNPTNAVGIPISLVEAAAAGLVIISIDSGGIREFIQEGVNGFLIPDDDWRALAKLANIALRKSSLTKKLGDSAKRTAARYSWPELSFRFYALYNRVATEKSTS